MYDPQTSGGLLISLPESEAYVLLEKLNTLEIKSAIVGKVIENKKKQSLLNKTVIKGEYKYEKRNTRCTRFSVSVTMLFKQKNY